jgi:two-component system, chemotaxis family, chemotaxis protein CheY
MLVKWILVVDDDPDVREVLQQFLTLEGYEVSTAANGREALERLHTGQLPGLILLDLMMPEMDGFAFRAQQRSDPALAPIPVVIITAGHDAKRSAAKLGVSEWMFKPVEFDQLVGMASRYCAV